MRNRIIAIFTILLLCVVAGIARGEEFVDTPFDRQVEILVRAGYPEIFGGHERFNKEMDRLRAEAAKLPNRPFLIVIPEAYAPLAWQLTRVVLPTGARLVLSFPADTIKNNADVKTPDKPYLIYDVSFGADTKDVWICDARQTISQAKRRGLTVAECAMLFIQHPQLLQGVRCAALASYRPNQTPGQGDLVPCFYLHPWVQDHPPVFDAGSMNAFNEKPYSSWKEFQFPSCTQE